MAVKDQVTCIDEWRAALKECGNPTCYVKMKDTFFSGWGPAEGKDNILIVPCNSYDEAEKLESWIKRNRPEMRYVNWNIIRKNPPSDIYSKRFLVQVRDMPCWKKEAMKGYY